MRKIFSIFFLLIFYSASISAQAVSITGYGNKEYANKTIKAFCYDDHFSQRLKEITSATLDPKGFFNLTFKTSTTVYVMLRIENKQATLYCEPNKKYEVIILPKEPDVVETVGQMVPVDLTFSISDSLELNFLLYKYDDVFETFLERKKGWTMKNNLELERRVDTFAVKVKRKFAYAKNSFFQTYIDYTCGKLKITFKSSQYLYDNYVKNKPILFDHPEYMNFMDAYFTSSLAGAVESAEMKKQVNDIGSLPGIEKYFKALKNLDNDTVRELAIIRALGLCLDRNDYKKDNAVGILKAITTSFKVEKNKKIAENYIYKYGRFLVGNPAPAFTAKDVTGVDVSLESFKGKFVYLAFFKTDCKVCEEEFKLIADYKKKYGNKIEFVYVSIDSDPASVKKFLEAYPKTSFPVLNNSSDQIKEDYQILSIPTYYFITPQGTFRQAPALNPGLDMEKILSETSKKK